MDTNQPQPHRGRPRGKTEEGPTMEDWRKFKQFYLDLFDGDDKADLDHLLTFLMEVHSTHQVSLKCLDRVYQFFRGFSEKLTRLKAKNLAKRSFINMRRKMLITVPQVTFNL